MIVFFIKNINTLISNVWGSNNYFYTCINILELPIANLFTHSVGFYLYKLLKSLLSFYVLFKKRRLCIFLILLSDLFSEEFTKGKSYEAPESLGCELVQES